MAVKFDTVRAGETLYDVHSQRMGNTTMRSVGVWSVEVVSVDYDKRTAVVRWNRNRPETWGSRRVEQLRRKKPELERTWCGGYRLKRRVVKGEQIGGGS